jgi:hypothetical protein
VARDQGGAGVTALAIEAPVFEPFPKLARLSRDMVVTEKLDGTNAQIRILEDGRVFAGSRNRWVFPGQDNFGFAAWVAANADELRTTLGEGTHFGEWWGQGIQRGYGLTEKRFSLFNTGRWRGNDGDNYRCIEAPVCHVVPVLGQYTFSTEFIDNTLYRLKNFGSFAAPGFGNPEGVVVFHAASGQLFKKTLDKHDGHKGAA